MHSPAFAMKAQQNNCLNITLKFITCRNTRGFQYMQIQKHITLHQGERKLETLLAELEKAEKYIFLEYFIVQEGVMWNSILEVLKRKPRKA